jgi:hypothetical protein
VSRRGALLGSADSVSVRRLAELAGVPQASVRGPRAEMRLSGGRAKNGGRLRGRRQGSPGRITPVLKMLRTIRGSSR